MSYQERKYTAAEKEHGRYIAERLYKALKGGNYFSAEFDTIAGVLLGYAAANGMTIVEAIERIGWLTTHDSPDGRTSEELLAAFAKGKAS